MTAFDKPRICRLFGPDRDTGLLVQVDRLYIDRGRISGREGETKLRLIGLRNWEKFQSCHPGADSAQLAQMLGCHVVVRFDDHQQEMQFAAIVRNTVMVHTLKCYAFDVWSPEALEGKPPTCFCLDCSLPAATDTLRDNREVTLAHEDKP